MSNEGFQIGDLVRVKPRTLRKQYVSYTYTVRDIRDDEARIDNGSHGSARRSSRSGRGHCA